MGNSYDFKLNYAGVGELLKCQELQDGMQEIGDRVAREAGVGFAADTQRGKKRAHTFVRPKTPAAYFKNLANNSLLKALHK